MTSTDDAVLEHLENPATRTTGSKEAPDRVSSPASNAAFSSIGTGHRTSAAMNRLLLRSCR
jgi:hypothetical protein